MDEEYLEIWKEGTRDQSLLNCKRRSGSVQVGAFPASALTSASGTALPGSSHQYTHRENDFSRELA